MVKEIIKKVGKTINKFNLIEGKDTVAVGISGGKDSLALLSILNERLKHIPVFYTLIPVFIRVLKIHDSLEIGELKKYCTNLTGYFYEIEIEPDFETGKDPCFICSWHRRKALFEFCKDRKIEKLALGHTLDDRIETLLMNLFYQGNISTMPVILDLFEGKLKLLRPLGETTENDIIDYVNEIQLPVISHECVYFNRQSRKKIRNLLEELKRTNPDIKQSISKAMDNIKHEYL
jgi:tRNA 2-thiocytidine biosynthesis protein TtcA